AVAVIQPGGDPAAFATAFVGAYEGDGKAALDLLSKIRARRIKAGGRVLKHQFGGEQGRSGWRIDMPAAGGMPAFSAFYYFAGGLLVMVDHQKEAEAMYHRIEAGGGDSLSSVKAFSECTSHVQKAYGDAPVHLRWFLEPFGYFRVGRAEQKADTSKPRRRGRFMPDVYADEGFDAIQGVGGFVSFAQGKQEILHRSFVYAPAVVRKAKDAVTVERLKVEKLASPAAVDYAGAANDKYFLGARMLNFANEGKLTPWPWLTDDLSTHLVFHWTTQRAFKYSETLVNALSDDRKQEVWVGTLDSIRDDVDGPRVDIRKNIVKHLGTKVTRVTDYAHPIDPQSERQAMIIPIIGDEATVKKAVDQMMKDDPDAIAHQAGEHTIWEINTEQSRRDDKERIDEDERLGQDSATVVANGFLIRGSHVDLLARLIAPPKKDDALAGAGDLKKVNDELDKLSDGKESFRYFDRLDRSLEQHWELLRTNRFPQSESTLANIVAQMQGYDPDDPATRERKQDIAGDSLPEFAFAAAFFGPTGVVVKSEADGWLISGAVLTKE
ncbi:MAG: hypothetical protein KDA41_10355, partial [Planctomycetales bacterium]|nr:hypothetical protein [Planctomycetales bacterium]